MTNTYHCYQPVGSVAVYAPPPYPADGSLSEPRGTPVLVTLVDHDDEHLHYGVVPLLQAARKLPYRGLDTVTRFTILPGYELLNYEYVDGNELEFTTKGD